MFETILNLKHYWDVTRGIRQSLSGPWPDPEEKIVRDPESVRSKNFLNLAEHSVFQLPDSPYLALFRWAGCSFDDLSHELSREGLDSTLKKLLQSGVYISHREFKEKRLLKRNTLEIPLKPESFLNPLARGWLPLGSGGSSGRQTRVTPNTLHLLERARCLALLCQEFSLQDSIHIALRPILPGAAGILDTLQLASLGCKVDRWFSPSEAGTDSLHYRWLTRYIVALEQRYGIAVPYPIYLKSNSFEPVAEWIARRIQDGSKVSVGSFISHAVRVAAAAVDAGCNIRDTVFLSGGEALTPQKRRIIESTGAHIFPRYHISEVGTIGLPCRQMNHGNCVHALDDRLSVIADFLEDPDYGLIENVLFFTSISSNAPLLLINVDMGDTGIIDESGCDCRFTAAGFRRRIRDVQSYAKLTSQGMTMENVDLLVLLESALPERFGGIPGDFQLTEIEGPAQTHLILRVHPRLKDIDPELVLDFFMTKVRRLHGGALASRTWAYSRGVSVERTIPQTTSSGKNIPILLLREKNNGSP